MPSLQTVENLEKAESLLQQRYVRRALFHRSSADRENWGVCGMGALSMTKTGHPSYNVDGTLDDELDMIAAAIERAPSQDSWWLPRKHTFEHYKHTGFRGGHDLPHARRFAAQYLVIHLNDAVGKAGVVRLLNAAACLARSEYESERLRGSGQGSGEEASLSAQLETLSETFELAELPSLQSDPSTPPSES